MKVLALLFKKSNEPAWGWALLALCAGLLLYIGSIFYAIAAARMMYADGALTFVALINNHDLWPISNDPTVNRLFSNIALQFPLVLLLKCGISNFEILRWVYGLGLYFVPIFFVLFALSLAWRAGNKMAALIIALIYVTCFMPSQIFIFNQAFMASAAILVLACYAILPLRLRHWDIGLVILLGIESICAHEGAVIMGPLLALLAAYGFWAGHKKGLTSRAVPQLMRLYIAVTGIGSALFNVWWLHTHPTTQSAHRFLALIDMLQSDYLWWGNTRVVVYMMIGVSILFGIALFDRYAPSRKIWRSWYLFLTVILFLAFSAIMAGVELYLNNDIATPYWEFEYRFLIIFGVAGWLLLWLLLDMLHINLPRTGQILMLWLIAGGIMGQALWQNTDTTLWSNYADLVRISIARAQRPIIAPAEILTYTHIDNPALRYKWDWAWPALGLALQDTPHITTIFAPEKLFDYFHVPGKTPNAIEIPGLQIDGRLQDFTALNRACAAGNCY